MSKAVVTPKSPDNPLASRSDGRQACGARTRNGGVCRGAAMANGRCRIHGGLTPRGPALPQFKHGKYSKHVPKGIKQAYDKAREDPQLLSLADDVAVLQARMTELLGHLEKSVPPPWATALSAFLAWKDSKGSDERRSKDGPAAGRAGQLQQLEDILRAGADAVREYEKTWAKVREVIQEKTKVAAAEWKRLVDLDNILTAEQAMAFVAAVVGAVEENVKDKKVLADILARTRQLLPHKEVIDVVPNEASTLADASQAER